MPKKKSDEKESSVIRSRVLSGGGDGPTGTTVITSPLLSGAGGADATTARKPSRASAARARVAKKKTGKKHRAESSADTSSTET